MLPTVRSTFRVFSQQTVLHGFSFATNSPNWIQFGFYVVLILISSIMMIRDSVFLFNKYKAQETKVDLFTMHNTTFNLDPPTLCFVSTTLESSGSTSSYDPRNLGFRSNSLQMKFLPDFTASFNELKDFLNSYGYNVSSICSKIKSSNLTFYNNLYKKNNRSLSLLFQTMTLISNFEYNLAKNDSQQSIVTVGNAEEVRQHLIEKNVDFSEVRDLISLTVCLKSEFVFATGSSLSSNFCSVAVPTWFGVTDAIYYYDRSPKVCYKFPKPITYRKSSDWFAMRMGGIANSLSDGNFTCHIKLDLSSERGYFHDFSQSSAVEICKLSQTVRVSISSDILSYNLPRQPCKIYNKLDCFLKCRQQFFIDKCQCFPVSLMLGEPKPSNLPYCASLPLLNIADELSNYTMIENRRLTACNTTQDDIQECENSCPHSCRVKTLSIQLSEVKVSTSSTMLLVSVFVYPYFVESLLLTWSDLLMAFGGSIGLW